MRRKQTMPPLAPFLSSFFCWGSVIEYCHVNGWQWSFSLNTLLASRVWFGLERGSRPPLLTLSLASRRLTLGESALFLSLPFFVLLVRAHFRLLSCFCLVVVVVKQQIQPGPAHKGPAGGAANAPYQFTSVSSLVTGCQPSVNRGCQHGRRLAHTTQNAQAPSLPQKHTLAPPLLLFVGWLPWPAFPNLYLYTHSSARFMSRHSSPRLPLSHQTLSMPTMVRSSSSMASARCSSPRFSSSAARRSRSSRSWLRLV